MDLFYDYFQKIKNILKRKFTQDEGPDILFPCNFSFCKDDEKINKTQKIIDTFKDEFGVYLRFSYSTDGLYAVNTREKNNTLTDEWFDKTLSFCKKNEFCCHPMISPENIDTMIDNYEWWKKKSKIYLPHQDGAIPWMFEVRQQGWTEEKI